MMVTRLQILNFLGLASLKIDPCGKLNLITGGNGVGKSSVLKAIQAALQSTGTSPELIRLESEMAEIVINIDEEHLKVRRVISAETNTLQVHLEGAPISKAQTFLNNLLGPLSFNPVDFYLADAKNRRQLLLRSLPCKLDPAFVSSVLKPEHVKALALYVVSIDWGQHGLEVLEDIREQVYDRRRAVNQGVTQLTKAIAQERQELPPHVQEDLKKWQSFDLASTSAELQEAMQSNAGLDRLKQEQEQAILRVNNTERQIADAQKEIEQRQAHIKRLEREIAHIERERGQQQKTLADQIAQAESKAKAIAGFQLKPTDNLRADIAAYQAMAKLQSKVEAINQRDSDLDEQRRLHELLDDLHKELVTTVPQKLLKTLRMPAEMELSFDGDQLLVRGLHLETLSSSEQLRFAVHLARSLAGELRVLCVDRFETLDPDSRKVFLDECQGDEFEYFITEVTSGPLQVEVTNGE